jgi:hypothetical protein
MDNPTRLQQLKFGLALISLGLLSLVFVLVNAKTRGTYRKLVEKAEIFK